MLFEYEIRNSDRVEDITWVGRIPEENSVIKISGQYNFELLQNCIVNLPTHIKIVIFENAECITHLKKDLLETITHAFPSHITNVDISRVHEDDQKFVTKFLDILVTHQEYQVPTITLSLACLHRLTNGNVNKARELLNSLNRNLKLVNDTPEPTFQALVNEYRTHRIGMLRGLSLLTQCSSLTEIADENVNEMIADYSNPSITSHNP